MTTQQWNSAPDMTSDATFRAWGLALSSALTAAGIPKTADTGQIDWTTVVRPASSSPAGYEIRYFNDSLNATAPIYIKIEYGQYGTQYPQFWITIGQSTDGAGNIPGPTTARFILAAATASTSPWNNYLYSDGSMLAFVGWSNQTSRTAGGLIIERAKDSTGAIQPWGYIVTYRSGFSGASNIWNQTLRALQGGASYGWSGASHPFPREMDSSASLSDGTNIYLVPAVHAGPSRRWYSRILAYAWSDITENSTFVATQFGASHTFMATAQSCYGARGADAAKDSYASLAIPWE